MHEQRDEERLQELVARIGDLSPQEYLEASRLLHRQMITKRGRRQAVTGVDIIRAHRDGVCIECGRDIVDVAEQAKSSKGEAWQMAESKSTRKVRVSRPRRLPAKSWLQEAHEVRERILQARGGVPLPSSAEAIREIRESD